MLYGITHVKKRHGEPSLPLLDVGKLIFYNKPCNQLGISKQG